MAARLTLALGGILLVGIGLAGLIRTSDVVAGSAVLTIGLLSASAGVSDGGWIDVVRTRVGDWLRVRPWQLALIPLGVGLAFGARAAAGDGLIAAMPGHAGLWLAGTALVALGFWRSTRPKSNRFGPAEVWSLAGISLAALILRTVQLADAPVAVSGDEGGLGMVAWEFVTRARTNLLALGWFSFPGLYAGLVSAFQALVGHTLLAIRLPSAVGGTLSIIAVYFAARALFGRTAATISAILLAGLHVHLLFSRVAVANVWDGFFFSVTLAAIWHGWMDEDRSAFVIAGLAIGLSQYFYATARLLPVLGLLWILVLGRKGGWRTRLADLTCLCTSAAVIVLPLALFYLGYPNEWLAPMTRVSVFNRAQLAFLGMANISTASLIFREFWRSLLGLVILPVQGVYSPWTPLLRPPMAILGIAGLVLCLRRWRDPRSLILFIGLLGPIAVGAFSLDAPNSQRMLFAAPLLTVIAALPLTALGAGLRAWRPTWVTASATLPILIALGASASDIQFFFDDAMPRGRFSDANGLIARELGDFLQSQPAGTDVYFIKPSSLGYFDAPGLRYLAPNVVGHDLQWPSDPLPAFTRPDQQLVFVTLPAQASVLNVIEQAYPSGETIGWVLDNNQPFFSLRVVWR